MTFHDIAADGQADAKSGLFGGVEAFEYSLAHLRRNAGTGIFHADDNPVVHLRGRDFDQREGNVLAGKFLDGVENEIDHHLLDLHPVDEDIRQAVLQRGSCICAVGLQLVGKKNQSLLDDPID